MWLPPWVLEKVAVRWLPAPTSTHAPKASLLACLLRVWYFVTARWPSDRGSDHDSVNESVAAVADKPNGGPGGPSNSYPWISMTGT